MTDRAISSNANLAFILATLPKSLDELVEPGELCECGHPVHQQGCPGCDCDDLVEAEGVSENAQIPVVTNWTDTGYARDDWKGQR